MNKETYCKCGHLLEPSHQKHGKFLGLKTTRLTPCTECNCNWYVIRGYPNLEDRISLYVIIGWVIFVTAILSFVIYGISDNYQHLLIKDPNHILSKKIITYKTMFQIIPLCIVLFIFYLCNTVFGYYLDYRKRKNREVKPVGDHTNE
jgi:hypothetical protein